MRSGFPFEMRIAAAWEAGEFDVAQSVYYADPESDDAREADILAFRENITHDAWLRFTVVVECKARHDAGWVMFRRRGAQLDPATRIRMLTAPVSTSPYLSRIARRGDVCANPAFAPRSPGYAMAQAKPARDKDQPNDPDR
jgi:hypothetical protein